MPRAHGLLIATVLALGPVCHAQDSSEPLKNTLRLSQDEGEVRLAAVKAFTSGEPTYDGKYDDFLEKQVLRIASSQTRRIVLEVVRDWGVLRPVVACRLARVCLSDPSSPEVRAAAANVLAHIDRPEAYDALRGQLADLALAQPGTQEARDLEVLAALIEKKRDPVKATRIFIEVLPKFEGPAEQRVHAALKRLTGRSFETDDEWARWWKDHGDITADRHREWYLEALKGAEDKGDHAAKAVEQLFDEYVTHLKVTDPEKHLRELEKSVAKENFPAVRARAIQELGKLGEERAQASAAERASAERAVTVLENLLRQFPVGTDDPILRATLASLGRTGRSAELKLLLPYLESPVRSVRLAAAFAVAALKTEEGAHALVKRLLDVAVDEDPDGAASYARAVGQNGRDPEGKASSTLLTFLDDVGRGRQVAPAVRPALLQAGADALGMLAPVLLSEGSTAAQVVSALDVLAQPAEHPDVRWWATTSLGQVPHVGTLPVLARRLTDEKENVRKAAIGAIAAQARRAGVGEPFQREAVVLLAEQLAGTDEALRAAAKGELKRVIPGDASFAAREALVTTLANRGAPDQAGPFLEDLPAFAALTQAQLQKYQGRYWSLIEARATTRLRLADGRNAAADFEAVIAGLGAAAPAPRLRALRLGYARALLVAGENRVAAERTAELVRAEPRDEAAWSVFFKVCEAIHAKGERDLAKTTLEALAPLEKQAPPSVQAAFADTRKKLDAPPPEPRGANGTNGKSGKP